MVQKLCILSSRGLYISICMGPSIRDVRSEGGGEVTQKRTNVDEGGGVVDKASVFKKIIFNYLIVASLN